MLVTTGEDLQGPCETKGEISQGTVFQSEFFQGPHMDDCTYHVSMHLCFGDR